MQNGHFVFRQVDHPIVLAEPLDHRCPVVAFRFRLNTHQHLCVFARGVTIIEFRDAALADGGAKATEAPRFFRNGDTKQYLALLADFGLFGNMPQAVEIDVGAAHDRNKRLVTDMPRFRVSLHPRDAQCA